MRKIKWLLPAIGATTMLVPVISTVAFAPSRQAATMDFDTYLAKVNDKTTDAQNVAIWNASVKAKFLNSNFYKDILGKNNNVWNIGIGSDVNAHLSDLYDSAEFTDDEKVSVAKYIINNEAFADFFHNTGFDVTIGNEVTQAQIVNATGTITDPSKLTSSPLTYNGTPMPLKGVTGINKDWKGNDAHDAQLNVSNQTVANYFTTLVAHSPAIKTFDTWLESQFAGIISGTVPLKTAMEDFSSKVSAFLGSFATAKTPVAELLKLSTFDFLQGVDLSTVQTLDDVYTRILQSSLGQILFGTANTDEMIAEFKATTSTIQKNVKAVEILSAIQGRLTAFENAKSPELSAAIYKGTEADRFENADFYKSSLKFAQMLLDYSNAFGNDIQLRAISDISISGYGLGVKSGHDVGDWTFLSQNGLDIPVYVASDSTRNSDILYVNIASDFHSSGSPRQIVNSVTNYAVSMGNLEPDDKAVMQTGDARNFYIDLQLSKGSDPLLKTNAIQMWENDHDNDGAVKYSNWTATLPTYAPMRWEESDTSLISNAYINFYYNGQTANTSDANVNFPTMVKALNDAKDSTIANLRKTFSDYETGNHPDWFDPTIAHEIVLTLTGVKFGQTYFSTYDDSGWDDTHVNDVRFANVSAIFSYQIVAINQ